MPDISFVNEFHHRYIKDNPMVSWNGVPYFPIEVWEETPGEYKVKGYYIEKKTMKKRQATISLSEDKLTLKFPEIGWLNVDSRTCVYFTINPVKQWRFALTTYTCSLFNPLLGEYVQNNYTPIEPGLLWTTRLKGKRIAATLWNRKYYSIKRAYDLLAVKKTHVGAAFSQNFALIARKGYKYPVLYYRKYPIGYTPDHQTVCIPSHMDFMKESLQEYFLNVEVVHE